MAVMLCDRFLLASSSQCVKKEISWYREACSQNICPFPAYEILQKSQPVICDELQLILYQCSIQGKKQSLGSCANLIRKLFI